MIEFRIDWKVKIFFRTQIQEQKMTKRLGIRHVVMPTIEFTPLQKAHFEILTLSQRLDLVTDHVVGGITPPEMVAENERRDKEYRRLKSEIIAKHGVIDEYLKPLREEEHQLLDSLTKVQQEIAQLENLRT